MSECRHDLKELMIKKCNYYEFIKLFYCTKCNKIFKKTLTEVKY